MRASSRVARVADFVRDELANIIRTEVRDPRVTLVSVNDVKVSKDLSYADVYVSAYGKDSEEDQAELLSVLNGAAGFMRTLLAKRHSMRTTPKPRFHYDALVVEGPKLDSLIEKALASDRAHVGDQSTADTSAEIDNDA